MANRQAHLVGSLPGTAEEAMQLAMRTLGPHLRSGHKLLGARSTSDVPR